MKILFDNGTPKPIARSLAGHEIAYARRIGWHELENGELIQQAEEAGYEQWPLVNAATPGSYTEVDIPFE